MLKYATRGSFRIILPVGSLKDNLNLLRIFSSAEIKKHSSLQLKFQGNFAGQYQDRQNHDDRLIHSLEYRNLPSYRR